MPPWFRWQQNILRIFRFFLQGASKNGVLAEKILPWPSFGRVAFFTEHERRTQASLQSSICCQQHHPGRTPFAPYQGLYQVAVLRILEDPG
jgi:hypothetical protein